MIPDVEKFHIPTWTEIPDIGLYMNQAVEFVNTSLAAYEKPFGLSPVTNNMVNNYVKAKIVDAPVCKKYSRTAIAMITVIYILKSCYSTSDVDRLIKLGLGLKDKELTYNRFRTAIEDAVKAVFGGEISVTNTKIEGRDKKYLMENFALSIACRFYVSAEFINV